jgi:hypothetical protein
LVLLVATLGKQHEVGHSDPFGENNPGVSGQFVLSPKSAAPASEDFDWIGSTGFAPLRELDEIKATLATLSLPNEGPMPFHSLGQILLRQTRLIAHPGKCFH